MAAKTNTDDAKYAYVQGVYDDLCKLDDAVTKAMEARVSKLRTFRMLQGDNATTAEMDERFPRRKRRSKDEIDADSAGDE